MKNPRFVFEETKFSPTSRVKASLTTVALVAKRSDNAPGDSLSPGAHVVHQWRRGRGGSSSISNLDDVCCVRPHFVGLPCASRSSVRLCDNPFPPRDCRIEFSFL